jgi:class 3 adenylate cyclase/tetratricopeptide (TPR) repeat protein
MVTDTSDDSQPNGLGGRGLKCPKCRAANSADAVFCDECGTRLESNCAGCGQANRIGAKFCKKCGELLRQAAGAPGPIVTARFVSPEAYTPEHIAQKILTSKSALEGERKQVTVLFADLKGSLELLADRDPEEARKLLDPVLERMMEAVHRYEGTVNQVMGDGIMALFGAPLAQEDHAVRACYAALVMQESVGRYAAEVQRTQGIPLHIRVGLNSGEVVVRSVSSDLRIDYSAVGQTTHLAARMEQTAMPGSILMAEATLRLAEGYIQVKPIGPVTVKGLNDPLEVYEVVGASSLRRRLDVGALRGLSRFVGRNEELEVLGQALDKARAGHGQVVAVVGEAGVGKSRLFWEFTHSSRPDEWLVLESASASYGKTTSYLPVIDLLKEYFRIEDRDEARLIREKVTGKILSLDRALEPWLRAFLWLLDAPVDDPQWERLEPPQRRQISLDGVKRLLFRESQEQPILIVCEDLHWIDAETQALLDSLVDSLPMAPLLLLFNYRPEYQHGWSGKTYYRQLRIDPLPPESADELLEALLGTDASVQPLKRLLIERTEGNPFFLEESVRTLVETKVLTGERGGYRLVKAPASIEIPATAQAILAARIDRLQPEDKRLLQAASVIGKDVPLTLLQPIAEASEDVLRGRLHSLQAAEFLYEVRLFPELEYTFKHALSQEVAYQSLPLEKRRQYHGHIAKALEVLFADRLPEKLNLLAYHYQQSGNAEKAFDYLTAAAKRAVSRFAGDEAIRYYEDIMRCLDSLPSTAERQRQRIDLRLEQVDMVWVLGRYQEGWRILEENLKLAERIDDRQRLARIHFRFGWFLYDRMDLDGAFAHQQKCFALCEQLGNLDEMRRVYWGLGNSCRSISSDVNIRRMKAIEFHRQGLLRAEDASSANLFDLHNAHFLWLIYLFQLGDWDEAMGYLLRADKIAKRLPEGSDVVHGALVNGSIGFSHLLKRKTETHLEMLRESLREAERAASLIYTMISRHLLGEAYFLVGDLPQALSQFKTALTIIEQKELHFHPAVLLWTAETETRLGRPDAAIPHLNRYEALIEKHGSLEGLAWFRSYGVLHRVKALIAQQQAAFDQAKKHFEQSIKLLSAHGYKPDLARTYQALGQFQLDQRQTAEARESLGQAADLFREMGFTLELNQTLNL